MAKWVVTSKEIEQRLDSKDMERETGEGQD